MKSGLVALLVAVAAGPAGAEPFQGTAVFHASFSDGKSFDFRIAQLGTRIRHEMMAGGGAPMSVSIFDPTTGQMTMLMPQKKKYLSMNMSQMGAMMQGRPGAPKDALPDPAVSVKPTGQKSTVAGIACDGYVVQTRTGKVEVCSARGLGMFGGMQGPQGGGAPGITGLDLKDPALARFAKDGFFPLRMTVTSDDGKSMSWEATSVDRHKPDAALFAPPSDYSALETNRMPPQSH